MKTKNIFRMLLVAAALLMGANNVKAGVDGQIWPANGANNNTSECSIEAQVFVNANISKDQFLRVYFGAITGDGGYWQLLFYADGESNPEFDEFPGQNWGTQALSKDMITVKENSYLDFKCSANTATKLKRGGFSIKGTGIIIKNVAIVGQQTDPDETDPDQTIGNVTATIGRTGYATFSNSSALNFSAVNGMKAYIATAVSNNQVTLTQVTGAVAANTGLVIIGNNGSSGEFNIPKVTSGTSYDNNLLVAGNGYPLVLSTTYTDYVLIEDTDGQAKFAEVWSPSALPSIAIGKAYLHVPAANGARIRNLSITISDGTTGINAVENEQGENVIYNLRGQRVENPTKGLYIINGKKVLIK